MRFLAVIFFITVAVLGASSGGIAQIAAPGTGVASSIPAGQVVRVRVLRPMSSADAKTGDSFEFQVLEDIAVNGVIIVPKGSTGGGVVKLAGPAGGHGHEGNLTLTFGNVTVANGNQVALNFEYSANGMDRKNMARHGLFTSGILTGFGAAIQGSNVTISPDQVLSLNSPPASSATTSTGSSN